MNAQEARALTEQGATPTPDSMERIYAAIREAAESGRREVYINTRGHGTSAQIRAIEITLRSEDYDAEAKHDPRDGDYFHIKW